MPSERLTMILSGLGAEDLRMECSIDADILPRNIGLGPGESKSVRIGAKAAELGLVVVQSSQPVTITADEGSDTHSRLMASPACPLVWVGGSSQPCPFERDFVGLSVSNAGDADAIVNIRLGIVEEPEAERSTTKTTKAKPTKVDDVSPAEVDPA